MKKNKWERRWPPKLPYGYAALNLGKALLIIEASKKRLAYTAKLNWVLELFIGLNTKLDTW